MKTFTGSVVLLAALALTAPMAQAGLVGYWNFDEGAGTTAFDLSGSGNNGTINAATLYHWASWFKCIAIRWEQ